MIVVRVYKPSTHIHPETDIVRLCIWLHHLIGNPILAMVPRIEPWHRAILLRSFFSPLGGDFCLIPFSLLQLTVADIFANSVLSQMATVVRLLLEDSQSEALANRSDNFVGVKSERGRNPILHTS